MIGENLVEKFCGSLTQGILIIDNDFTIIQYNKKFQEIFQCSGGVGEKCYKFLRNKDSNCENCPIIEKKFNVFTYRIFKNKRVEYKAINIDDKFYLLECFFFDDIIEVFGQKIEELKFIEIGHISAAIAHKVNNILMAVSGKVEAIEILKSAGNLSDEYFSNSLKVIEEGLNSIKELMSELLNFAHPERLQKKKADLNKVIKEFYIFSKYEIERPGVKFLLDLEEIPLVSIEEKLFIQMLIHLCRILSKNFYNSKIEKKEIVLKTKFENKKIKVIIQDNNNIEATEIKNLIERLFQLTYENLVIRYAIIFHEANIFFEFKKERGNIIVIEFKNE